MLSMIWALLANMMKIYDNRVVSSLLLDYFAKENILD